MKIKLLLIIALFCSTPILTVKAVTNSPTVKISAYKLTRHQLIISKTQGSATIISDQGLLLTNFHVISDAEENILDAFQICLDISNQLECQYTASVVATNPDQDLALLQINKQDAFGKELPSLNYLPLPVSNTLDIGDSITIRGFPDIGGKNITQTKGQVSGFEKIGDMELIKTDTDISSGNSGGTALNDSGQFIGIPTYVISSIENLGYLINLNNVVDWIKNNYKLPPQLNPIAQKQIENKFLVDNTFQKTRNYQYPYYPHFKLKTSKDWELGINEQQLVVLNHQNPNTPYQISISIKEFPFVLNEDYISEAILADFEENQDFFKNYQRQDIIFHGIPALVIEYGSPYNNFRSRNYVIPYGQLGIIISYEYDLDKTDEATKIIDPILNSLVFQDKIKLNQNNQTLQNTDPPFEIKIPAPWGIISNHNPQNDDLIAEIIHPENIEAKITIGYHQLSRADQDLSINDYADNLIRNKKSWTSFQLIHKEMVVNMAGMKGFAITYNYESSNFLEKRQVSEIYLFDKNYYFLITYDDLASNYPEYLADFKFLLSNFRIKNNRSSQFQIGSLNYIFTDIAHHRFEKAISHLKDQNIINGFIDQTFKPERPISRIETLKAVIESKIFLENQQKITQSALENLILNPLKELDFNDSPHLFKPYLQYARHNSIIKGHPANLFYPYKPITLAETSKIIVKLYDIPIWQNPTISNLPWYKPYLDKLFELELIPQGVYQANHLLTRGELAYILDKLMSKLAN